MSVEASRKHGPFDMRWPPDRRIRLVPHEPVPPAIEAEWETAGAERLLAAVAAVHVWEGEGGYTPGWDES
jgi:hypothetical protein